MGSDLRSQSPFLFFDGYGIVKKGNDGERGVERKERQNTRCKQPKLHNSNPSFAWLCHFPLRSKMIRG
jgi:hypothetical protein